MRAILVAAFVLLTLAVAAPAADARPPGGGCQVNEEYVTEARLGGDRETGYYVEPGAHEPFSCYY